MSPLEFMQRLAALVPRPRLHLIRFHNVLAPSAKLRCEIIPTPVEYATDPSSDPAHGQGAPALSWHASKDPPVIVKILSHLGLPTRAPPRASLAYPCRVSFASARTITLVFLRK